MEFWILIGGTVPHWLIIVGLLSAPVVTRRLMKTHLGRRAIAAMLRQIGRERV
jgi:hypothetical protein